MESSRNVSRQRRRRRKNQQRENLRVLCGFLILLLAGLLCFLMLRPGELLLERVSVEAGTAPSPAMFLVDAQAYGELAAFKTDMSTVNINVPGEYPIVITINGKDYSTVMEIVDKTPPAAAPSGYATEVGVLPEAYMLVADIKDVSDVTVSYYQEPDVSKGGTTEAIVRLTDAYGNTTDMVVELLVTADEVPPVIEGAVDLEYFLGESISYKSGITVTDDETESPKLSVDNSQVDSSKAGTYPVTYTATDDAGNTASVTVQLTLKEKPKGYVDKETVYDLARKVLDDITNDSMTDMEVAFAIYKWTKSNIAYTGSSDKSSWTKGAYQAFTKKSGDCYNYFAAAKALYDVAGIENVDVIKSDTSHSSHYWSLINLGDGWYHVDCTPRRNVGYFFMNTDAELEAYSKKNKNSHIFDTDAYPERATESVQDLVDYKNGKVKG
jgi:transglutaminase-like putative cysteine protease